MNKSFEDIEKKLMRYKFVRRLHKRVKSFTERMRYSEQRITT